MTITIKMSDSGSIVTVHNPKSTVYFTRPLLFTEVEAISEYGEEYGTMILQNKITNSKRWDNYKFKKKVK